MKETDLIKYNQECLKCRQFISNKGTCKGRFSLKANCLAFKKIKT